MHIAVCDDEPATLAYLSALVRRWGEGRADPVRVERFPSAQALWFEWEAKPCFDLFLLDIQMQGLDGVTLARKIRAADEKCAIIFITGTAEFAADGYDVSALHYLLKPIDEAKLFACLDKGCGPAEPRAEAAASACCGRANALLRGRYFLCGGLCALRLHSYGRWGAAGAGEHRRAGKNACRRAVHSLPPLVSGQPPAHPPD